MLGDFATRLTGSADLYAHGRRPTASINLITVHDGFTMADLVSYDAKHNEANGEDNRDGTDDNRSWNCGVEGPTDDPQINALRARQRRNLLATLLLSEGVPLLLGGDELGRTQGGNNNAYCQDNALSWIDWSLAGTEHRSERVRRGAGAAAPPQPGARPRAVPGRRRDRLVRAGRERRWSPPTGRSRTRARSDSRPPTAAAAC